MKFHIERKKLIVAVVCVIIVMITMYLFILPNYVIDRIERANFIDVWHGEIRYQTDDTEDISTLLDNIDITNWQRIWVTDMQLSGLPDAYITVDQEFNMDFWIGEEECFIKIYFHSSKIEIASYRTNRLELTTPQ